MISAVSTAWNAVVHPHDFVGRFVIPNQAKNLPPHEVAQRKADAEQMRVSLGGDIIRPKTEDNVELDAFYFSGIDPKTKTRVHKSAPTAILFAGLGCYHYYSSDLVQKYMNRGFNVAIFNYRSIGESGGTADAQGMVKDGVALVDYMQRNHGVAVTDIIAHGHSLGGGPSSGTAVERPGVIAINERSYSSLSSAGTHFIKVAMKHHPLIQKISGISPMVLAATGWEFNTAANWGKIKGKKIVVYHPDDEVICKEAGLFKAIYGKDPNTIFVELGNATGSPHSRPLKDSEADAVIFAATSRMGQDIAISTTPVFMPQEAGMRQPVSHIYPKSFKNRIVRILLDIFSVLFFPLGIYCIIRTELHKKRGVKADLSKAFLPRL